MISINNENLFFILVTLAIVIIIIMICILRRDQNRLKNDLIQMKIQKGPIRNYVPKTVEAEKKED